MLLPASCPNQLISYVLADSDEQLFEWLIKNRSDLILFFLTACEDEAWVETHSVFMAEAIKWLMDQLGQNKFSFNTVKPIAKLIQKHHFQLKNLMPYDLTVKIANNEFAINSFLFAGSSQYFYDLFQNEVVLKQGDKTIQLKEISYHLFMLLEEFIRTGNILNLWRHSKEEIQSIIRYGVRYGLTELADLSADILRRYVNASNVIEWILEAYVEGWLTHAKFLFHILNEQHLGVSIKTIEENEHRESSQLIALEFFEFSHSAILVFDRLKMLITHLICKKNLTQEAAFSSVLMKSAHLIGLDISETKAYSERLADIPGNLQELYLSDCTWLNDRYLAEIARFTPQLRKIQLSNNSHLPFFAWKELQQWKQLEFLDLSRNQQIDDSTLSLILTSCSKVIQLELSDCVQITDVGFSEISRLLEGVMTLNLSYCGITDGPLADICLKCKQLTAISLVRCRQLSEKGIIRAISTATHLNTVNLKHNHISTQAIAEIQKLNPLLNVIH